MAKYEFKARMRSAEERDRIRAALVEICKAAGFFSRHQKTIPSPPEMLRFIARHPKEFEIWVRAEKNKDSETKTQLLRLGATGATNQTRSQTWTAEIAEAK